MNLVSVNDSKLGVREGFVGGTLVGISGGKTRMTVLGLGYMMCDEK